MTRYEHVAATQLPSRQVSSRQGSSRQAAAARQVRDDGLRRVRKLTFRVGLVAAAAAAFIGAKFAHLTAPSIHLPSSLSGNSTAGGGSSSGGTFSGSSSTSGISSSSGISSVSGGGLTTSGGS